MKRHPVSFAQQRIWFIEQLAPGQPTYHMSYCTRLTGPLDADALQRALDRVVARHDPLRTAIDVIDGEPEQVVADTGTIEIRRVSAGDEPAAEAIVAAEAQRAFDLAHAPLARATLIAVAPDRHLFVLVLHHIISDGRSMEIITGEISAAYRDEHAAVEPLPVPYGDYAVWQRDRLRGEELERQLAFWRGYLDRAPDLLALPTAYPRPARRTFAGRTRTATIDTATAARLRDVAQQHHATVFMALLSAYAVVAARFARQPDVLIATLAAARTHVELEPVAGLFANTIPLRVSLAGDPTFATVLRRVRQSTIDALAHQELPFEKIVTDLGLGRTMAHAPLCQVQFAYAPTAPATLDLPGVDADVREVHTGTAKLDLQLYGEAAADGSIGVTLEYSTDLFDDAWADRFLGAFGEVVRQAAATPDAYAADLPLLTVAQGEALVTGQGSDAAAPAYGGFVDVLAGLAASRSVVTGADGRYTMGEICAWAARIARVLIDRGAGPETAVGLHLGRGAGMLAGLIGVWWAGAAYVPLDPVYPQARLAAMADRAGVAMIVSDEAHRDRATLVAGVVPVIGVDDLNVKTAKPAGVVTAPGSGLAYTIFTSGSTGVPKGVGVPRSAVAHLLGTLGRDLGLGRADRFVAVTTLSFDISVLELLLPPLCGADLIIADADQARESDRLAALIRTTGATAMQATPQTWRMLVASGGVPDGLRLRLCGGEALPRDLADVLATAPAVLWDLYGPTETTVWSAGSTVGPGPIEIGPALGNTRVYVLDDWLVPVPDGVVGHVYIGGSGVTRGYTGAPGLTAAVFVPDPWSDEPGARMYRTGDLGSRRPGGGLALAGRSDHQVKIRGFRIECGEVEAVLRSHPDIRQVAVVARARAGANHLVAYVVPRRNSPAARPDADLAGLTRDHMRTRLPDYMLPSLLVALPSLPLTANAKVDRAALPEPRWDDAVAEVYVAPRNPVEQELATIWADVLERVGPIGVHDDLFALGGHSLTATRLVARVSDAFGVDLPVHEVFAGPTIAEMAERIAADPDFGRIAPGEAALDALTDDQLDDLLAAALAQREKRRSAGP